MKRRAFKFFVFLLAGAMINVAVAWCIVAYSTPIIQKEADATRWIISRKLSPLPVGATDVVDETLAIASLTLNRYTGIACEVSSLETQSENLSMSGELVFDRSPQSTRTSRLNRILAGLPTLALAYEVDPDSKSVLRSGVRSPWDSQYRGWFAVEKRFPLMPLWPGVAINTIFYAAIAWMLFAAPFAIRKRVRRKRGQCAACGYSLRENVSEKCPECGAVVSIRSAA